ncbi:MAG: IS66 family transposase [Verrucomicrobiales bacterium]|nr:IS66 family transposase [Verrucomicrobiales bacterium]
MKPEPSPEALAAENQRLREALAEATARIRDLEHQIGLLKRCVFGSRSEKVSVEELEARIAEHAREALEELAQAKRPDQPPPEAEEEQPEEPEAEESGTEPTPTGDKRKARPHGRAPLPAHLPRRRIEHPIAPGSNHCPHCPEHPALVKIGEDIREKLHRLPVQYEVHQHVYPKLACPCCHSGVVMPEAPDHGLKADLTVVADVVVQKYGEHKPLYRQQQAFARLDIPLSRQTLCDWVGWCSDEVTPIVRAMADFIRSQLLVQSDETPVRMQSADGQMHVARLWAYGLPWQEVVFDFRTDKSHQGPAEFLRGARTTHLQADGGSSYEPVLRKLSLAHVACMAHIRRKIFEARDDAPLAADLLLASIQRLYRIERLAKEQKLSLAQRLELRQREARPLFEDVEKLLDLYGKDLLPKSPLARAVSYARNQWPAMARYLEMPGAELDNNSIEHALRGVVMGRRNWLHVGQEVGGERAANLFSLIISCHRLGVEPYGYLCDVLPRISRHPQRDIWQLTPRGWKETRLHQTTAILGPSG